MIKKENCYKKSTKFKKKKSKYQKQIVTKNFFKNSRTFFLRIKKNDKKKFKKCFPN